LRLQFILGKPGTGKTTMCHNEISAKQAANGHAASAAVGQNEPNHTGNRLILIVPEQFSFQSEKALLSAASGLRAEGGALSRAQVLSFNRLSYYVLGKTGGVGRVILENSGKNMVLRKIISSLGNEFVYFKSAKETSGFLDSLATCITEFFQYGISPDDLESQAKMAQNQALGLKLTDLHLIYSAYRNFLEENFVSSDEVLDILAEKIPQAEFLKDAEIWIDGFKSFTPQEKKVLSSLLLVSKRIKIALPAPKKSSDFSQISRFDIYSEVVSTMESLTSMAEALGAKIEEPIVLKELMRHQNAPDLAFLTKHFLDFATLTKYDKTPQNIHIFTAENIFAEIDEAARMVVSLTRDRGYKYSEIGLIAADLPTYEKFAPAIFGRYGIPMFVDVRRSILGHPVVELIFAACQVISSNRSYEAVFRLLRLPVIAVPKPQSRHEKDEIDLLENYVLAYNIKGKTWQEDFRLGQNTGQNTGQGIGQGIGQNADLEALNISRQKLLKIMEPLSKNFTPRRKYPLKDFAKAIYDFLLANNIPEILGSWMDEALSNGDNEALREHEQIWDKIMDTLDKMVEILPEQLENISGFAKILEAGLMDLGLAPPSLDQLVLGDLRRSRFGEVKAMIILGAKDGALPSRPADDGILSDDDRYNLEDTGLNLAKDSIAKIFEEEFLIYSNFSKPQEFLSISYPTGDLAGGAANPARSLQRIKELFPEIDWEVNRRNHKPPVSAVGVFTDLILKMGQSIAENTELPQEYLNAYAYFKHDADYKNKLADMEASIKFVYGCNADNTNSSNSNNYSRRLSKKSLQSLYKPHIRTGVSKLQRYIACPFSYFVEYNLAARPRKLHEVAAVDMGNIYHDILAKFGDILKELNNNEAANDEQIFKLADEAALKVIESPENYALRSSGRYMHFSQKMRAIAATSARALAAHLSQGGFEVAYNEVAFGGTENPIKIDLFGEGPENAQMLLEGRIDRVDITKIDGAEYVKIIDYKSGSKQFSLDEVYHGLDMQLLVYLGAFISQLAESRGEDTAKRVYPAAAFYFNLLNPLIDFEDKLKDPEILKKELLKEFKMSGLVLDNESILSSVAETAKKSGTITAEDFAHLLGHVINLAKQTGQDILEGKIPIKPFKHKDKTPCDHCNYRTICKFDPADQGTYRRLKTMKPEEVLKAMKPEEALKAMKPEEVLNAITRPQEQN
jgi:ATP-dependent helicase/nuclease subunit B